MSTLGEANRDAYRGSIDEGSAAPLMGFMDAMDASWQSATKVHSLLAVEQSMRALEQEQIKKIREAGLRPPKSLDDSDEIVLTGPNGGEIRGSGGPFSTAQFKQGRYSAAAQSVIDGGGWYTDELVAERNKEIETLRKERPDLGLMTYEEIFAKVREQSQEIEKRAQGPTTLAGSIGGFIGGAAGAMNPLSDPTNAATMFVGGGSGVAARIGVQGALSAGVEAGNMALTPNNENILLNRQPTFGEDMARIGFAAAGGVGGQALGEVATMGARRLTTGRWFNDVPPPPEPIARPEPPPEPIGEVTVAMAPGRPFNDYPDYETFRVAHKLDFEETYGKTRPAELRRALDLDHVTRELDRWDGPAPYEIAPPRTDVAFSREIADGVTYDRPYQKYLDNLDTIDDIARRIDPDLFREYDKLARQRDEMRAEIDAAAERFRAYQTTDAFFERGEAEFKATDAAARMELQKIDQQMRDLAPLVTRAYSAAEKEWRSTPMDWNTMSFLKGLEERTGFNYRGEGKPSLTEQPMRLTDTKAPMTPARTVDDTIPLAKLTPDVEGKVKVNANADATERVRSNVADEQVAVDEKIDAFVTSAVKVTKLTDVEIRDALKALDEKLAKVDPNAENAAELRADIQAQIDELKYVTLPDGSRLDMLNDRVPFVDVDGNETQMTVRDFLREMQKDNDALKSVVTCSRPS